MGGRKWGGCCKRKNVLVSHGGRAGAKTNQPAANQHCIHNGYLGAMGKSVLAAGKIRALMRDIPEAAETVAPFRQPALSETSYPAQVAYAIYSMSKRRTIFS